MPDERGPVMPQEDNAGGGGTGRMPKTLMISDQIASVEVGFSTRYKLQAAGIDDDMFAGIALAVGALI